MGCANSKQSRCKNCQAPYAPVPRSYSMHVHHPSQGKGDSYHMVALTSTTLGSLRLETSIDQNLNHRKTHVNGYVSIENGEKKHGVENGNGDAIDNKSMEFSMGVIEAKTWSNMIDQKIPKIIPKTPIRTPPGEPETINTWELMEGLEDTSPLQPLNHIRSFSFNVVRDPIQDPFDRFKERLQDNSVDSSKPMMVVPLVDSDSNSKLQEDDSKSGKPLWIQIADNDSNSNSNSNSIMSDLDPDVISSFRKSLEDLSPDSPFYLRPLDDEKAPFNIELEKINEVALNKKPLDVTELKKINVVAMHHKSKPLLKEKVVLYFTSLRGVRKTYEDCCHVRVIIKGLDVRVDERDVSMDSGFKDELRELLGDKINGVGLNLPRVFIGRKYIGGVEEIRIMNEDGQLEKVFECCEKVCEEGIEKYGDVHLRNRVCEACGDVRFIPCETCSGSCKIYYEGGSDYDEDEEKEKEDDDDDEEEKDDDYDDEEEEDGEYGFRRCPDCNENGLIRCPVCCD